LGSGWRKQNAMEKGSTMTKDTLVRHKYITMGEETETVASEGWTHVYVTLEEDFKVLPPLEQLDTLVQIEKELIRVRTDLIDKLFINSKYPS